jgi:hypothetical protein
MPGVQHLTRVAFGKETVKGTPVAPTRRWYGPVAGNFDIGDDWRYHEEENRGVRTRPSRAPTQVKEFPQFKLQDTDGVGYDDLVVPFSMGIRGGQTGTGAGADKSWTFTAQNAGANNQEAFSADVGDDTQNWRLQYVQPTRWKLSTELSGLWRFESDLFAQRAIKTAAAVPAEVSPVKVGADLWTLKFAGTFAGLTGASVQTNFLRTMGVEWFTGLKPRFYHDGNLYFGQTVETDLMGKLNLEVESTALAVSELVDKYRAGTLDFVRLKATGPTLGATNYSLQFDMPVYWEEPKVIASADDQVNIYTVVGKIAYDPTAAKSLEATLVCSLSTIP